MNRKGTKCSFYPCGSLVAAKCCSVTTNNGTRIKKQARKSTENLFFVLLGANRVANLSAHTELSGVSVRLINLNTLHRLGLLNEHWSQGSHHASENLSSASDRGINPNTLHRSGFMPRKHLHQYTTKTSLGTGCRESSSPCASSPRRQEWDNKGKALGFDLNGLSLDHLFSVIGIDKTNGFLFVLSMPIKEAVIQSFD